jgi:hypothetical protein
MLTSVADGLRAAGRQPKLVVLLWAWYALLSLIPALPAYAWLTSALNFSPAAATALQRFDFGLFGDLMNYDQSSVFSVITMTMFAAGIVALVSSAFVMGGTLEVLCSEDDRRTFMHRFYRGGGHFFWRFVRLALLAGVCLAVSVPVVSGVLGAAGVPLAESEWEPAGYLVGYVTVAVAVIVAALFLLALDYARIRVAREDSRKMLRAYFGSLGFVLRHLVTTYGIGLGIIVMLATVMGLYVAYETNSPAASTGALILTLFVLQQVTVAARVYLRVSLIGAEWSYYGRAVPVTVPAAAIVDARAAAVPAAVAVDAEVAQS